MSNPAEHAKSLAYGDFDQTLSIILKNVCRDSLGAGGTAVVSLFFIVCQFLEDRSVSEITQFVIRARQGSDVEPPNFVRAGQALIRYALGEEAFEATLLTRLDAADFIRIVARLLVSMVKELAITEAEFDGLLREAAEMSRGFTLSSVPLEESSLVLRMCRDKNS